jgi:hypothetical protein
MLWSQAADADEFSPQEWAIIKTLSPLPDLPADTTNEYRNSPAAARLGQKLFFEPRLSGPIQTGTPADGQLGAIGEKYKIACRNCHMPESKWLFDIRSNNHGPIPNATALDSARTGERTTVILTPSGSMPKASRRARRSRTAADSNSPTSSSSTTVTITTMRFRSGVLDPGLADYQRFRAIGSLHRYRELERPHLQRQRDYQSHSGQLW